MPRINLLISLLDFFLTLSITFSQHVKLGVPIDSIKLCRGSRRRYLSSSSLLVTFQIGILVSSTVKLYHIIISTNVSNNLFTSKIIVQVYSLTGEFKVIKYNLFNLIYIFIIGKIYYDIYNIL